jgi:hypothetical protein
MDRPPELVELTPSQLVLCYGVWLVLSAGIIWLMIEGRINLLDLALLLQLGPWVLMAIDRFGILLLGVICLSVIIFLEHYLRTGMLRGQFWPRVGRVLLVELVLLAFTYAFQFGSRVLSTTN